MVAISIIIPFFNTAECLERTVCNMVDEQMAAMPAGDWELILVDDGSTDGSARQIESYLRAYPDNIRLIVTPNRGVSSARNRGLEEARGRYVYFMDSDDLLLRGSLPMLMAQADKYSADMVNFSRKDIGHEKYLEICGNLPAASFDDAVVTCYDAMTFMSVTDGMIKAPGYWSVIQTVFRRDFLTDNGLLFNPEMPYGEDADFTLRAMLRAPRLVRVEDVLYLYHERDGSAIHNQAPEHLRRMADGRLRYVDALFGLREEFVRNGADARTLHGLSIELRNVFNRALVDMIITGSGYGEIVQKLRWFKRKGGRVKPGRPRFHVEDTSGYPASVLLKRWLTAYPVAFAVSLSR